MASNEEIIKAATELGRLIGKHKAASRMEKALKTLQGDKQAQQALNSYNQLVTRLAQKEAMGQPIEVSEKRELEKVQGLLAHDLTLREFQLAQMDYLDLMRSVDEAIESNTFEAPPASAAGTGGTGGAGGTGGGSLRMPGAGLVS